MKHCLCLLLLITCITTSAQEDNSNNLPPRALERIDSLFADHNNLDTPGYAVGISQQSTTLLQKGYGAANLDYRLPITPKSAFSIASVSKQFTAACLALLILDEDVSLETPAANFVPELAKYRDTIRIKHLVYNTSGLTDYYRLPRKNGRSWITFNYFDVAECLSVSLAQDTLLFAPGQRWDYCNVNFMLLTRVVEKVSGQSFAEFAHQRLFTPLGMTNTLINDDITAVIPNRVIPYNERTHENVTLYNELGVTVGATGGYIAHHRNSPHFGGSGVITTVEDLLKWSKNMVSQEFGGPEFYRQMHQTGQFAHGRNNQAFGLYCGDFNGHPIVAWDGGDWGISTQLMRFPEQGIAITVLSNLGSGEAFRKVNAIADILMEAGIIR